MWESNLDKSLLDLEEKKPQSAFAWRLEIMEIKLRHFTPIVEKYLSVF